MLSLPKPLRPCLKYFYFLKNQFLQKFCKSQRNLIFLLSFNKICPLSFECEGYITFFDFYFKFIQKYIQICSWRILSRSISFLFVKLKNKKKNLTFLPRPNSNEYCNIGRSSKSLRVALVADIFELKLDIFPENPGSDPA